jgi:hypothetical protein
MVQSVEQLDESQPVSAQKKLDSPLHFVEAIRSIPDYEFLHERA